MDLKPENFLSYNIEEAKLQLKIVYEEVPFTKGKITNEMLYGILSATDKKPCTK